MGITSYRPSLPRPHHRFLNSGEVIQETLKEKKTSIPENESFDEWKKRVMSKYDTPNTEKPSRPIAPKYRKVWE